MKISSLHRFLLLSSVLCISTFSFSQNNYLLNWGEGVKLKRGTADLAIIAADKSGIYFTEERKLYNEEDGGQPPAYTLYKLNQQFAPVFTKEYKKELKGLAFQSFQTLGDGLYLFSTDYSKKEKSFKIYGAAIDKNTGVLKSGFGELADFGLENNRDNYEIKVTPLPHENSFLMVTNISSGNRLTLGITLLDNQLKEKESLVLQPDFDPNYFQVQDIHYTRNKKIILLGKEFESAKIGNKKRTRLVFKQFVMSIYNLSGDKEKDVTLNTENRYTISGRLIEQEGGGLLLAGFYSNAAQKTDLNGVFINKVDTENGVVLLSSFKEINAGMLGKNYVDGGDEKEEAKEAGDKSTGEEDDEFPNSFIIKTIDINPADQSIIITSESSKLTVSSYFTQRYNTLTRTYTTTSTYIHRFITQDILLICADKNGNINWLNVLPKSQLEEVRNTENNYTTGFNYFFQYGGYFTPGRGMPFYSSYKSFISGKQLILLLNDHNTNNVTAEYGDPVRRVSNFRKRSALYGISVDLSTGKISRKQIASNNDEAVLMPRHGFVWQNNVIIPSWRQHLVSKTDLRFATVTVR